MISAGKESATTNGQIADDERMTRQRPRRVRRRHARAGERIEVQLGREHAVLTRQSSSFRDGRRHLTEDADARAVRRSIGDEHGGRLTRNEKRLVGNGEAHGHAERAAHFFDEALGIEEVHVAAAARPVIDAAIARPRETDAARLAIGREPGADFEQPHVPPAVPAIVRHRVDQSGHERRTQRVEFRRQRVGDGDRRRPRTARPPWPR